MHYASWKYYVNLALSHLVVADHESSSDIYKLYPTIFTTNVTPFSKRYHVSESLTNQAVIAMFKNSPGQAVYLFKKAFDELPTLSLGAAIVKFNLACLYSDLGEHANAAIYHKEAVELFKKLVDTHHLQVCGFLNIPQSKETCKPGCLHL